MATESISDIVVNDLLSELKLKPWWEKYRGYCFAVSVAAALSMTYVLQSGGSMTCLPDTNRTEIIEDFSTLIANFVNTFCVSDLPFVFVYAGAIALVCCGVLLFISTAWLHDPKVIDAFETYSGNQKVLEDLQLTTERLKALSVSPMEIQQPSGVTEQEINQVRKACARLWNYSVTFKLRHYYLARNVALCVASLGILVGASYTLHEIIRKTEGLINCTIPINEISAISISRYNCTHKTAPLLIVLIIAFISSIFFHLLCVYIGIWKTWDRSTAKYKHLTKHWEKVGDLLMFINTFWRNSRPINSRSFDDFFDFIASSAPEQLSNRLKREPETCDIYSIDLYSKLGSDWEAIATCMQHYMDSSDINRHERYLSLLPITDKITKLKWNNDVENFVHYVYQNNCFELFVSLLNIESSVEDDKKVTEYLAQSLKPDLDAIGRPYEMGRSILYYALRKKRDGSFCGTAAARIMKFYPKKAYVHCDGKSYSIRRFADWQRFPGFGPGDEEYEPDEVLGGIVGSNEEIKDEPVAGFDKILVIREKFKKKSEETGDVEKSISWTEFATEISRLKFTPWNNDTNKFAREICRKRQWEVLVALMNALIVEQGGNEAQLSEILRNFRLELNDAVKPSQLPEQRGFQGTLLYYALTERDYHPFTFNAAKMILSATKGRKKTVLSGIGGFQQPEDFVSQHSNLKFDQKNELLRLITESAPEQQNLPANGNSSVVNNGGSNQGENNTSDNSNNENGGQGDNGNTENQTVAVEENDQENSGIDQVDSEGPNQHEDEENNSHDTVHHETEGSQEPQSAEDIPMADVSSPHADNPSSPLLGDLAV